MAIFFSVRLKANALFITVIISLVIVIFCSMLLLLAYYQLSSDNDFKNDAKLERDLKSAINLALADTAMPVSKEVKMLDPYGDGKDSMYIKTSMWGLFKTAFVHVYSLGKNKTTGFFVGQASSFPLNECLYLVDHKRPLSISGATTLLGDAHLPSGILTKSIVEQKQYTSPDLITGRIKASADSLPPIDPREVRNINLWARSITQKQPSLFDTLTIADDESQSFADSPIIIHNSGPIYLSSCHLKGQIEITSDCCIRVSGKAQLENVVLASPVIVIQNNFIGSVQALATDSLITGKDCHFSYPSALVLLKGEKCTTQPVLRLGDSSVFAGMIFTYTLKKNDLIGAYVECGRYSQVTGIIYATGTSYLKGIVYGTVLADYLVYRSPATYYQNYLVDAVIDRAGLSKFFVGPPIMSTTVASKLVQWIN